MTLVTLTASDGSTIAFEDVIIGQGGQKDVYMSADRTHVAAFFRKPLDPRARERLQDIVGRYRTRIFDQAGGDYWRDLFCWPSAMLDWDGRTGLVVPTYRTPFFFEHGSVRDDMLGIRGKEKEGKWFSSASNRNKFLDAREKGTLLTHLAICIKIARAVRRLHAAGLAHSDLSYKNVLVDPVGGNASIIDIDGLVVPGKYPPEVVGTPDFIAPEVVATQHLSRDHSARVLPSIATDRHALAVLIYMYLFFRHPLRGGLVHNADALVDEALSMGTRALFVEHPTDRANAIRTEQVKPADLPWASTIKLPYRLAGPLLAPLFESAFVAHLHAPAARPTADDWETALVRTTDLLQPCANPRCEMKWFVYDGASRATCPYCRTRVGHPVPVLDLHAMRHAGDWSRDDHRIAVHDGQSLFAWHVDRGVFPGEKLSPAERTRVGYFQAHRGDWYLVNERLPELATSDARVPVGQPLKLEDGQRIVFSAQPGARMAEVRMAGG